MENGPPGFWESFIPVWGSGRQALYDFLTGHPLWGTLNAIAAISDVFLAKAAVTGLARGAWKFGSHSWRATRTWLTKVGYAESGQHVHHWLIPQGGWGRVVSDTIKNQPWNLLPLPSSSVHQAIHGVGRTPFNLAEQFWHGTPQWLKAALVSGSSRSGTALRGTDDGN